MGFRTIRSATFLAFLTGTAAAQGTLFPVDYWYPAVDGPFGSTLADVNADGKLDYFVVNNFADSVSIFLGTGTGLFNAQPPVAVGAGAPRALAVAELNGDNKPDLITVNSSNDVVAVLFGDGLGGFGAPTFFPTGNGTFPSSIVAGDLDGDGDIDLVTGDQSTNELSVLPGNGAGSFGSPRHFPMGYTPERIQLTDMNVDGKLDCVMSCWGDDRVVIALGDGNGNMSAFFDIFAPSPFGLAVGDMNADGKPDVATASTNNNVYVFFGSGAGTLQLPKNYWMHGNNYYPTSLMLADVSGDGRADLITCNAGNPDSMTVFVNVGGGDFGFTLTSPIQEDAYDAVAGDLNGDGIADVVTSNLIADSIRVHMCAGVGCWERYCTAKVNSQGCTPTIFGIGTPSVSNARPFWVYVYRVLDSKPGLFLYTVNGSQASTPFQGGTLCIGPSGIRRTPGMSSGTNPKFPSPNCEGVYALNWNAFAQGLGGGNPSPGLLVIGNSYQIQVWSRDPGFAAPNNSGLSPAFDVTPWL
ncbi:MAG TPA: VCBS repeat-containing protein [Planctomycetota bacterium]|nr:VCBS repeat-containing protein [Planctomycetota bacterium]